MVKHVNLNSATFNERFNPGTQTIIFQLYTIDISLLSPSINDMTKKISTLDLFIYNLATFEERKGKFQPLYQN